MKLPALVVCAFVLIGTFAGIAAEQQWITYEGKDGPGKGKHIVLLAGDEEYRSEEAMPMLGKILSQRHGFKCTVLFPVDPDGTINPTNQKSLPGSEALDSADAIVMALRFRAWRDEAMERFVKAFERGVPIVALRTSTHAFNFSKDSKWAKWTWNNAQGGFGKIVLGETWVSHWGVHKKEATRGVIEPGAKSDSILRGVSEIFGTTDVYEAAPPSDAKILVRGLVLKGMTPGDPPADYKKKRADKQEQGVNDPAMPIAWTRSHKNDAGKTNRIFCTTMGAATDLENEGLRRMVVNAVFWALRLKVPDMADVGFVDPFKPTRYGFNSFRKGLKPADHALGKALPASVAAVKPDEAAKAQPKVVLPPLAASKLPLELIKGERIAFVGNSTAERFNRHGWFEALLHSRFPQLELVVRNFARPADEVGNRQRPSDYTKLDDPFRVFGPDTIIAFFGFNESFAGPDGVEKFKADYEKLLDHYAKTYPRGDSGPPRFLIVSPMAFESPDGNVAPTSVSEKSDRNVASTFLPDGETQNENLKLYAAAVAEVAKKRGIAFIDFFGPTSALFNVRPGLQLTLNGAHQNQAGDRELAQLLDRELFGSTNPAKIGSPEFEKLREAINDKSWVHAQDYRMLNGWYVYGGRRTHDTETFPLEYIKIRNMAAVRDRYVWHIAQGKPVAPQPDDSKTGELIVPATKFGTQTQPGKEPKELKYLTPEESIATMKVPDGFEVQLIASEREFPAIANVNQINFDNKGRLWASCMANYPQWRPGDPRPNDRLLILDDIDPKTGRAGKCTVFYDKLICPTGFEFWNGGVIVVDEPRLIWLRDLNGDDKADVVEELSDGWATEDTHHTIGAFEWSPGGLLHMLEGVSMSTAIETPWGPLRNFGSPGCYVLDPRSMKVRHFITPGYGNPWCYVFDSWGQGIVGDGTTPQQHWDTPLSTAKFPGRKGLNPLFPGETARPNVGTEFIYTRQFPDEVQGLFIWACVINMHGLTTFTLGDDGAGYKGARRTKEVDGKKVPDDLLDSTDMSFRPTDPHIGPDGALYFGDWSAALIGHMQYSQRDPNRDHTHGRLYRLIYKDKPLLDPVTQFGKSIPELLDQLTAYEPRTRYRARRELWTRTRDEVLAGVREWVANLDTEHKDYDRHLLEALWLQQSFHAVNVDLLKLVLRARTPNARAGATRVLADEWERIPNPMELINPQVTDEFARTRVEAIRALSFVNSKEAAETILLAANHPRDYWIDYTLEAALTALQPMWKPQLRANNIAQTNPKGLELLHATEALTGPSGAAVGALRRLLAPGDISPKERTKLYGEIAKAKGDAKNGQFVVGRICVSCHKVAYQGMDYGPDLTDVGKRMKKEDIIESIIDPNAKLDPRFIQTNITAGDGHALTGFVSSETAGAITLKLAGGIAQEIKKADIKKREELKQSSMPEGLAGGMSPQEFIDVIEYLASLK